MLQIEVPVRLAQVREFPASNQVKSDKPIEHASNKYVMWMKEESCKSKTKMLESTPTKEKQK